MAGPKRASGPRSNMYSGQRFTNWAAFDPFSAELDRDGMCGREVASVTLGDDRRIPVNAVSLKSGFLRPYTAADVVAVLSDVPERYLAELRAILLLGGTEKQRRARQFRYGFYDNGRIYLHPLAQSWLVQRYPTPPKPSIVHEFTKFGASSEQIRGEWVLRFTEESARLFYLYDVLLHELGHHVERHVRPGGSRAAERYASWFADYQASRLLEAREERVVGLEHRSGGCSPQ